ncbi:MAG: hypothetical protein RL220_126, partial [Bacteroidota bacterium]
MKSFHTEAFLFVFSEKQPRSPSSCHIIAILVLVRNAALIFLFACLGLQNAWSQSGFHFVENRGQWPEHVRYQVTAQNMRIFLESEGLRYHAYDLTGMSSVHAGESLAEGIKMKGHVYDVQFAGCNERSSFIPSGIFASRFNYYLGNNPDNWASSCRSYQSVTYQELYDDIDLHFYQGESFLKYDFIVKPGGNPELIQCRYDHVNNISVEHGKLVIKHSVGEVWEQRPFAYQVIDGTKVPVKCQYLLSDKTVSFEVGQYDERYALYIDPELIFSTYSGSYSDNFGYTATYDSEGYLYSGSSAFGNEYPVTPGAYQTSWAGGDGQGSLPGIDMAITKYDVSGTDLIYSTYLGGSHDELPHSLICDENNTLYVYGTTSSPDFPVTNGAFDNTWNGGSIFAPSGVGADYVNGSDIVVAHFSADGSDLLASTFLGGSGNDGVNTASTLKFNYADEFRGEIDIDPAGNVIIATSTYSSDFPMTGALQPTAQGGQEACLIKLTASLDDIIWSTYVGGALDDSGNSVAFDSQNNIYFCGGTKSTDFPVGTGGIQTTHAGGITDGWVLLIAADGSEIMHGTYYGSNQYDQIYFVETDDDDMVHVYGQTMADDDFFVLNAGYSDPNSGMLVSKFDPALENTIWSTVFGTGEGEPNLSPTAFLVDVCGKIYMSGWGGSTNTNSNPNTDNLIGMEATPGAYQTSTNGSDFYFLVLEADASELVYASFF